MNRIGHSEGHGFRGDLNNRDSVEPAFVAVAAHTTAYYSGKTLPKFGMDGIGSGEWISPRGCLRVFFRLGGIEERSVQGGRVREGGKESGKLF